VTYADIVRWLESINPILATAVMLITIIGGGYGFYLWLTIVVLKPKLKLRLPSNYIISRPDTKTRNDHRWGHVEVINESSRWIKSCQAWISSVTFSASNDGSKAKPLFTSKIALIWTGSENRELTEISPKKGAMLDVFKFRGNGMVFSHDSEGRIRDAAYDKGKYIIDIECIAENAKPDKICLEMTFEKDNLPPTLVVLK